VDGAVTWTKVRRVMVGSGVWGEYYFFPTLLERDFGKGGCGNVVSSVDLWRWLATMGEIESRIVDPCRCQDLGSQNTGVQQRLLQHRTGTSRAVALSRL